MKTSRIIFTAVVVMMVAALVSCGDSGGGGGEPGLPGALKKPAELSPYDTNVRSVLNEREARNLVNYVRSSGIIDLLSSADSDAFDQAFYAKYGMAYYFTLMTQTKADIDVAISGTYPVTGGWYSNDTATVTVTGKSKGSISSNRMLGQIFDYYGTYVAQPGDWMAGSASYNKTFNILASTLGSSGRITGWIRVEGNGNEKQTLKEKAYSSDNDDKWETSSSGSSKVQVALSVSNGTMGAKLIFSYASQGTGSQRSAGWSQGSSMSAVEVYDNYNNRLFTLQSVSEDVASSIAGSLGENDFFSGSLGGSSYYPYY